MDLRCRCAPEGARSDRFLTKAGGVRAPPTYLEDGMETLAFIIGMALGGTFGMLWKHTAYRNLRAKYDHLTDRDERGRFVKRDR